MTDPISIIETIAPEPTGTARLAEHVDGIDHLVHLVGVARVTTGAGYFGKVQSPADFYGMREMPVATAELGRCGNSDEDELKILGGNWNRVFGQVWQ